MSERPPSRIRSWLTLSATACTGLILLGDCSMATISQKHSAPARLAPDFPRALELTDVPKTSFFVDNEVRPLFSPHRRPAPTQQQTQTLQPPADEPSLDITLEGVIIGPNSRRACLRTWPDGASRCLKEGRSIDGWTLTRVYSHAAVLRQGEHKTTLSITRNAD